MKKTSLVLIFISCVFYGLTTGCRKRSDLPFELIISEEFDEEFEYPEESYKVVELADYTIFNKILKVINRQFPPHCNSMNKYLNSPEALLRNDAYYVEITPLFEFSTKVFEDTLSFDPMGSYRIDITHYEYPNYAFSNVFNIDGYIFFTHQWFAQLFKRTLSCYYLDDYFYAQRDYSFWFGDIYESYKFIDYCGKIVDCKLVVQEFATYDEEDEVVDLTYYLSE